MGGLPSLSPAYPAFSLFVCPHPPDPLPGGKGEIFSFFLCKGLRPLHPRGLNGARHWLGERWRCPVGGVPSWSLVRPATAVPCGGLPSLSPAYPAFSLLSRPHPPNPLPSGKGEIFSFFMQGASPLASPGAERGAALALLALAVPGGGRALLVAGSSCHRGTQRGACPLCRLPILPLTYFLAPIPPTPFPAGRGRL